MYNFTLAGDNIFIYTLNLIFCSGINVIDCFQIVQMFVCFQIVQIGKILNAHMNSLQWIDEHILQIQNKLDEVSKLHDLHRRENERSFRLTYE